jgi:hypothetical protein
LGVATAACGYSNRRFQLAFEAHGSMLKQVGMYIFFVGRLSMSFGLPGLLLPLELSVLGSLHAQTSFTQPVMLGRIFRLLCVSKHKSLRVTQASPCLDLEQHQLGEARWMQRGLLRLPAKPVVISVN